MPHYFFLRVIFTGPIVIFLIDFFFDYIRFICIFFDWYFLHFFIFLFSSFFIAISLDVDIDFSSFFFISSIRFRHASMHFQRSDSFSHFQLSFQLTVTGQPASIFHFISYPPAIDIEFRRWYFLRFIEAQAFISIFIFISLASLGLHVDSFLYFLFSSDFSSHIWQVECSTFSAHREQRV